MAAAGQNTPLPTFAFMSQYSISFIFDFKEHHSQTADPEKKSAVMSTCSFITEKQLDFRIYFQKDPLPSKIPDYVSARQPKFFRDICEVFSAIQIHFADV